MSGMSFVVWIHRHLSPLSLWGDQRSEEREWFESCSFLIWFRWPFSQLCRAFGWRCDCCVCIEEEMKSSNEPNCCLNGWELTVSPVHLMMTSADISVPLSVFTSPGPSSGSSERLLTFSPEVQQGVTWCYVFIMTLNLICFLFYPYL